MSLADGGGKERKPAAGSITTVAEVRIVEGPRLVPLIEAYYRCTSISTFTT